MINMINMIQIVINMVLTRYSQYKNIKSTLKIWFKFLNAMQNCVIITGQMLSFEKSNTTKEMIILIPKLILAEIYHIRRIAS